MAIVRVHCSMVDLDAGVVEGVLVYGEELYRERLLGLQEKGYCVVLVLSRFAGLELTDEEFLDEIAKCDVLEGFSNSCICMEELSDGYVERVYARWHGLAATIYESNGILIRESMVDDAESFCKLYQNLEVKRYVEAVLGDEEQTVEAYQAYIHAYKEHQYPYYEFGMYSLVCKKTGNCVGRVGLEYRELEGFEGLSLGYAILPEYRGKGYVTEACRAIVKDCFEAGYGEYIYLYIEQSNKESIVVASSIGAQRVGQLQNGEVVVWKLVEDVNIV